MSDALVQWLLRPETYAEPTRGVTLVETHISWVFLTDRFAYKLKKPVRFDFLDFSTVESRRWACEEEVRLNRRLAADVYLGVVAARRNERGQLVLDEAADGEIKQTPAVDWLVKMKRLPADRTLDELHRSGQLTDDDLTRLAQRLADFYRNVARPAVTLEQYRGEIERHVRANRAAMLEASSSTTGDFTVEATTIKRTHAVQLQMLALWPKSFDERVAAGRIVDGHGDLRPGHVYFVPEPVVIDCIEFSAEFRHLDLADELSFLATECDFIGAAETGRRIAEACSQLLDDQPPAELLAFYRAYRACVRAKVAALRGRQLDGADRRAALAEAARHLELADHYTADFPSLLRPLLLVVHGLTGSGKSTLAAALADRLGAELLSTDAHRREMFGRSREPAQYDAGHYEPPSRMAVYDSLFAAAEQQLADGLSVVLDGTFLAANLRRRAGQIAERDSARLLTVHCSCPDDVARERIARRIVAGGGVSESRPQLYARQKAEEELSVELHCVEVDTTIALVDQVAVIIVRLRSVVGRAG